MRTSTIFFRGLFAVLALMSVLVLGAYAYDLINGPINFSRLGTIDINEARHINNAFNRSLNQLLAVFFAMVSIAVPLTANMYSVKFLELFIKDKVNLAVLAFVVFSNLNNTWAAYALRENGLPWYQLHSSFVCVFVCYSLLLPYLYYVFRFLHPQTLLATLEEEASSALKDASRHGRNLSAVREEVSEAIEHIANIAIRSIDRLDRATAIQSVASLERVARCYLTLKPTLTAAWFDAEQQLFQGFSSSAVEEICQSRLWVEMKLFSQVRQIASGAIPKTHDVVSAIAKSLRKLGLLEEALGDTALRELVMEYFNTLIRLTIARKDVRSLFTIFDHYRIFAEGVNDRFPEQGLEIAYYFEYYGNLASTSQLSFAAESIAHDLGGLVRHAFETGAPNCEQLLKRFLHYDAHLTTPLLGVKKAQAILASYFIQAGNSAAAGLIAQGFSKLKPEVLHVISEDLKHVKRTKYWEVNDRRFNFDYVPEPQREKLWEFLESLKVDG